MYTTFPSLQVHFKNTRFYYFTFKQSLTQTENKLTYYSPKCTFKFPFITTKTRHFISQVDSDYETASNSLMIPGSQYKYRTNLTYKTRCFGGKQKQLFIICSRHLLLPADPDWLRAIICVLWIIVWARPRCFLLTFGMAGAWENPRLSYIPFVGLCGK